MKMLIYGLITGILFGFLLQKARVIRYDKQLGALRLLDMTIVKPWSEPICSRILA
jgi:hypothetical protein